MPVLVQTTYSITPDPKTIAGYITALEALKTAGAPTTTVVNVTTEGSISVTVADLAVIRAISTWADAVPVSQPKIEPVAVKG